MDDPSIYSRARIDPPANGGPSADPGTPRNVSVLINSTGAAVVSWEGTGPTGAGRGVGSRGGAGLYYTILRQGPGEATPRVVGATGERRFIDEQPPLVPGAMVLYWVRACRGSKQSPLSTAAAVEIPAMTPAHAFPLSLSLEHAPKKRAA
jgi:hypothetical protein